MKKIGKFDEKWINFADALKQAKENDIIFRKEEIETHSEVEEKKTGYIALKVGEVPIPENLLVSYVYGHDEGGDYWYVVCSSPGVQSKRREYEVNSEDEARMKVFQELERYVQESPGDSD